MATSTYTEYLTQTYQENVAKYPALKKRIKELKDRVLEHPYRYAEGLGQGKWRNLKGLRSVHMMRGKYVLLVAICEDCIRNGHLEINLQRCGDICTQEPLKRVVFLAFGQHDSLYGKL